MLTMTTSRSLKLSIFGILSLATAGHAQEFFREYGTSRTSGGIGRLSPNTEVFTGNNSALAPEDRIDQINQEDDYNMRFGNLDFVVAFGTSVEFNDNITLAHRDKLSDIILRPQLDFEGVLNFSETNKLNIGIGIGYAKYLDHSEFDTDGLLVSPTSALRWTAEAGAFKFTVRERLSYQEDPFNLITLTDIANFKRWENQAGIQVDWDASQYTKITAGYDRYDMWTKDEEFESLDHGIDTIYLRPSYQVSPTVTAGLNVSYSWVDYRQNVQADARVLLVGPFIQWKASEYVDVYAEVGYQQSTFDDETVTDPTATGVAGAGLDSEDTSGYYAKLSIVHRPSEHFRHRLEASKTTELGYGTNYYDLYHVEYSIDWKIAENTSLSPTLFYEWYETSGSNSEDGYRLGAAIGLHHIYSEHLTIGLDYRFLMKDSNLSEADYRQNLGLLSLYYKF